MTTAACFVTVSVAGAGAAFGANGFTFDDVDSEDAQAIETYLETATTDSENSLPSGRGTMMVVDTVTDPAICREFVVNLSDVGQKSANGCRTGSGSWALADGDDTLGGEPLMIPPPGSRPDISSQASVPARLAGVPTIDIPQIALAPPQIRSDDPPSGNADLEVDDSPDSSASGAGAPPAFAALTPLQRPEVIREIDNTEDESTGGEPAVPNSDAVPARLAGFPSPEPRPTDLRPTSPPSPSGTDESAQDTDDQTPSDSTASPSGTPSGTDGDPADSTQAEAAAEQPPLRPVPENLNNFPQPQPKPSS